MEFTKQIYTYMCKRNDNKINNAENSKSQNKKHTTRNKHKTKLYNNLNK